MDIAVDPPSVRQLAEGDLAALAELQAAVTAGLPAGFLWPRAEGQLRAYLDGTLGAAYGVVEGGALAAVSLLHLPSRDRPNAGPRFRLVPEADWPLHACFLIHAMVRPAARGRGHQRALLDVRLARAAAARMRWACAGVRLENRVSWANLLAKGMAIADIRLDLGFPIVGLLGAFDATALRSDAGDRRSVRAHDAAQHQAALEDGYVGVRLAPDGAVIYQRLLSSRGFRGLPFPERLVQPEDAVGQVG